MARRSQRFCAFGLIRGDCGHEHANERAAQACVIVDVEAQALLGLTSDRVVCEILSDGERRPSFPSVEG